VITEMNFNFKKIGDVDISSVKQKLFKINEDVWLESQIRQKIFDAHRDT
jgi:hypothetical protein